MTGAFARLQAAESAGSVRIDEVWCVFCVLEVSAVRASNPSYVRLSALFLCAGTLAVAGDAAAQIARPEEMMVPPSAFNRIEAAGGRTLPCGGCPIPIERAMRQWQGVVDMFEEPPVDPEPDPNGNTAEWPPARSCDDENSDDQVAPPYPPDGFYGDELCDPTRGAELVRSLLHSMHLREGYDSPFRVVDTPDITDVPIDAGGPGIYDNMIDSLPDVEDVDETNYCAVFAEIEEALANFRYVDPAKLPGGNSGAIEIEFRGMTLTTGGGAGGVNPELCLDYCYLTAAAGCEEWYYETFDSSCVVGGGLQDQLWGAAPGPNPRIGLFDEYGFSEGSCTITEEDDGVLMETCKLEETRAKLSVSTAALRGTGAVFVNIGNPTGGGQSEANVPPLPNGIDDMGTFQPYGRFNAPMQWERKIGYQPVAYSGREDEFGQPIAPPMPPNGWGLSLGNIVSIFEPTPRRVPDVVGGQRACSSCAPGELHVEPNMVNVRLDLGTGVGGSVGYLLISEDTLLGAGEEVYKDSVHGGGNARLATPACVSLRDISGTTTAKLDGDALYQVRTPQGLVQIEQIVAPGGTEPPSWKIDFYEGASFATNPDTTWIPGTAFHRASIKIELVSSLSTPVGDLRNAGSTLVITESRNTSGTLVPVREISVTEAADVKSWQVTVDNPGNPEDLLGVPRGFLPNDEDWVSDRVWSTTTEDLVSDSTHTSRVTLVGSAAGAPMGQNDRVELHELLDEEMEVEAAWELHFHRFDWGEELVKVVSDPEGEAHTTEISFNDTPATDGYRRPTYATLPDGTWRQCVYDEEGRLTKLVEQRLNSEGGEANNDVVEYEYTTFGNWQVVASTRKVLGEEVATSASLYKIVDPTEDPFRETIQIHWPTPIASPSLADAIELAITDRFASPAAVSFSREIIYPDDKQLDGRINLQIGSSGDVTYTHYSHTAGRTGGIFLDVASIADTSETFFAIERISGPIPRDMPLDLTDLPPVPTHDLWAGGTGEIETQTINGIRLATKTWVLGQEFDIGTDDDTGDWLQSSEDEDQFVIASRLATARESSGGSSYGLGRPTAWRSFDNTTTTSTWDCCGSESSTDAAGITSTREKDGHGRLIRSTTAEGTSAEIITEQVYDREGRVVETRLIGTDEIPVTQSVTEYDAFNRVVATSDALGRETANEEIIDSTNRLVYSFTTLPDPDGSGSLLSPTLTEVRYPDGRLAEQGGTGAHPVKYEYGVTLDTELDQYLEWTKEIRVGASSATTEWIKTHVDGLGRTVKVEYADGATERSYYNSRGEMTRHVDADGLVTHYRRGFGGETGLPIVNGGWGGSWSLTARAADPEETAIDFQADQVTRTREQYIKSGKPVNTQAGTPMQQPAVPGNGDVGWGTFETVPDSGIPLHISVSHVWTTYGDDDAIEGVSLTYRRLDGLGTVAEPEPGQEMWSWSTGMYVPSYSVTEYPGSGVVDSTSIAPDGTRQVTHTVNGRTAWTRSYMDTATTPHTEATYGYDPRGRTVTITDTRTTTSTSDDRVTTYQYDDGDRTISVTSPDPSTGTGVGLDAQVTETEYDNLDRVTKVTQPDGSEVFFKYYPTGQLQQTYGARTYPAEYTYDPQGRIKTLVTYQAFNESTGSGTSGAATTTWNYDSQRGWLTSKIYHGGGSNGPAYEYWPSGRLKKRTWTSPRGVFSETEYNEFGQVHTIDHSDATPDIEYTYDRQRRLINVIDAVGERDLEYNVAGQLLEEDFTDGELDAVTIQNSFDVHQRRAWNKVFIDATLKHQVSFGYETDSSRLKTVTKGSEIAQYAYAAHDHTISTLTFKTGTTTIGTGTRIHDEIGRLTSIGWDWASDDEVYAYTYNDANERTEIEWADGSHWDFAYDPMGQVTSGKRKWSDGDFVRGQQFEYTFDDIGNRTQVKMGGNSTGGALRTMNYSRNLLNQITQRAFGAGVDVMGYAPSTSSVTLNGDAAYRHSEFFQKLMVWDNSTESRFEEVDIQIDPGDDELRKIFLPQTPEEFTYDADGNLTQDGRWTYTWDAENRLVQMETRTGLATTLPRRKIEFVYDYIGRRCIKRVYKPESLGEGEPEGAGQVQDFGSGGVTEEQMESPGEGGGTPSTLWELESVIKFVWDGWNLVAELDGDDEVVRTYAWGLDLSGSEQGAGGVGGLVFQQDGDGGTVYRVSMDGNGNVMTLRDGSGGRVAAYEYGPFGETLTVRGSYSGANPMRFSTKYNDPESALYYYGYRYYNTGTGRWLSRDPLEEMGGVNSYAMAFNSAVRYIDMLGLLTIQAPEASMIRWVPSFDVLDYAQAAIAEEMRGSWWLYIPAEYLLRYDMWVAALGGLDHSANASPPNSLSPTNGPSVWGSKEHRGYLYFAPQIECSCGKLQDQDNGDAYSLATWGVSPGWTRYPFAPPSVAQWHPTLRGIPAQRWKTDSCVTVVVETASRVGGFGATMSKLMVGAPPFVGNRITYRVCCNGDVNIRYEATIFPATASYVDGKRRAFTLPSKSEFVGFLFTTPSTVAPMKTVHTYNRNILK